MSAIFEKTSDDLIAARVGDVVFAVVERSGNFLISSTYSGKPVAELARDDFWGASGIFDSVDAAREEIEDRARDNEARNALGRIQEPSTARTPWGQSQGATHYGDGVVFHSTATHGGFKLSRKRNAMVHPAIRKDGGWYEEDSEFNLVVFTFPEMFTDREKRIARLNFMNWYPDEYEAVTGEKLVEGQSRERDRALFEDRHADDYIVISALGEDDGVHCHASLGGKRTHYEGNTLVEVETVRFLVPKDEYAARSEFGFVIDPDRHQRLDEAPVLRM